MPLHQIPNPSDLMDPRRPRYVSLMGEKAHGHSKGRKPPSSKGHRGGGYGASRGGKGGYGRPKGERGSQPRRQGQGRRKDSGTRPQLDLTAGAGLPRWVQEEVNRSTRKERRQAVLQYLEAAAEAFADAKYGKAAQRAQQAKEASSSNATIREILGLSYYRLGRWKEALKELRGFRRIAGETTHMPVEMDCLRALERFHDVEKVWAQLHDLGGRRDTMREARVVYGSYLLDAGRFDEAWKVVNPKKIHKEADESSLRQWYVAARVAAHLGDGSSARQLVSAITTADPGFPGLDQLEKEIAAT